MDVQLTSISIINSQFLFHTHYTSVSLFWFWSAGLLYDEYMPSSTLPKGPLCVYELFSHYSYYNITLPCAYIHTSYYELTK